ncbi:MAG: beta-ketoacyl synthase N-terminal-like domain-containing protein, partial [Verrucomicrobiota bacterium JB022]|nr:beta-ketoacyl synthase N-terminal-like domain-containing protein [Verrucomicrobiota bacterium JB022]
MSDSPTVDPQAALERYARRRAFQIFGEMGWPTAPAGADALTDALRITPAFRRLLDALIDVWTQEGLIDSRLRPLAAFPLRARLEQESAELCAQFPAAAPHVHLLDTCVDAYPEVLRGQRSPVEVLFPGGSLELVEPIYRGDDITRHYNAQLARLVERYVSLALEREPNRQVIIVEAGAGTGGSTPGVVARLRPFGPQVRYVYTDVSTGFLDHGRRLLEGEPIATEFHTLDLERCPVAQGYEGASVDLVFGVNVFHATRNCTATLRRLRTLLRANGLALVGEACANWTFSTLTFGLTDGWWRFDDPELRLPHSPLLSPEGWSKAFVQAGYHHARAYARPTDGWTIVGAESAQPLPAQAVPKTQPSTCPASPPIEGGEVADWVRRAFQEVTKLPMASLKSDETFENFGVDSLVAIKIARKLEETVGKLPTTLLFEHPTIDRLAAHLAAKYAAVQPTTAAAATPQPTFAAAHPEPARDEDIAIIGLAARFPGADSLDAFWQLLCEGRSAIGDLPADRWPWFDRSRLEPGTRRGGFLAGIDRFDPLFFRLSPREAAAMDPQERLFLQAVWWALEDAAYTREGLRREFDRSVGVFAGIMNTGYEWLGARAQALGAANGAHNAHWSVANRVSYFLDLAGPSLAVDTACSSSLTALHLACESLRRGECRLAFAGGVNLVVSPEQLQRLGRLGMLAKDGRSRSFGAGGTGMVDGEGVGVAVLRPLQEALAAGDRIYAVIKGSAINAGGKTSGYTVPSPDAQGAVVAQALRRAGVAPEAISYVEAHGTGTPLGDPIELAGLTRALGNTGPSCALGSVKSNLGHLESAAGIAGLIKVVLQLQHHELVPSLEAEELNPEISWSEVRFAVQRQRASWLASGLRQAGLSSFGAGGANAHVVIAEAPTRSAPSASHAPEALVLSALDADRLAEKRRQLAAHLRAHPELSLADIAHTLQVGREAMEVRWGAVVASHAEALRTLEQERPSPANTALGQTLARWLSGEKVDWAGQRNTPARRIALPLYPFAQERCWIHEPATSDPTEQSLFRGDEAYFADHVLQGSPVLPGAALLAAAAERLPQERLTAFTWRRPVRADALASLRLEVHGEAVQFVDAQGAVYADARRAPAVHQPELLALETAGRECTASMIYPRLEALGLRYGPSLRVLKSLRLGKDGAVAQLSIPQTAGDSRARMTALLDAALQATAFALGDGGQKPMLPRQIGEVQLARPILTEALLEVRVKHLSAYAADVQILAAGEPIAWLQRAEFQPFAAPQAAVSTARPSMLEFLRRLIAAELELAPERLHKQRSFDAYGVDSVLMLRVVERLEQTFGEQPKTLLFEHPTLEALASYFADRTVPGEAPSEISEAVALSATPAASEPSVAVAIIGLAGRFPGPGASGLLALEDGEPGRENQRALGHFWHNLWAGHDAVTDIPEDRWDWRAHHEA